MESKYYFVAFVYHIKNDDMTYKVGNHYIEQRHSHSHFSPREAELSLKSSIEMNKGIEIDNIVVVNYKEVDYTEYINHFSMLGNK